MLPPGHTSSPAQLCSPAFPSRIEAGCALPRHPDLQTALLFPQLTNGARWLFDMPWCPAEQQNSSLAPHRWLLATPLPGCQSQQWGYFRWLCPGVSSLKGSCASFLVFVQSHCWLCWQPQCWRKLSSRTALCLSQCPSDFCPTGWRGRALDCWGQIHKFFRSRRGKEWFRSVTNHTPPTALVLLL